MFSHYSSIIRVLFDSINPVRLFQESQKLMSTFIFKSFFGKIFLSFIQYERNFAQKRKGDKKASSKRNIAVSLVSIIITLLVSYLPEAAIAPLLRERINPSLWLFRTSFTFPR